MERLSDQAIEIINELHTERLDYSSEYIPLIDAANRLAAYEDTGLEPEDFKKAFNEGALLKLTAQYLGTTPDRLREWAQTDKEDRLVVLHRKYRGRDGERALRKASLAVNVTNNGVNRYTVDAIAEKLVREEAEAALEGASE